MIILSSSNKGKIKEFKDILGDHFEIVSKEEEGFSDVEIEETGTTLKENAYLKAKGLYDLTKNTVIADDTGLFIDSLDNRPGIYSRRYAGENVPFEANIDKVLDEMKDVSIDKRNRKFMVVICLIEKDGKVSFFDGECKGRISKERCGTRGFGYDSIFIADGYDHTWAEMEESEKNKVSHRKKALRKLEEYLK